VAQIVVRNLDESVKRKLKRRAERAGHSMEAEIRRILAAAAAAPDASSTKLGSRIADRFHKRGLDADIPELRGHQLTEPEFET
jgi:plasmid stability protein